MPADAHPSSQTPPSPQLSAEAVRKVASLSRLAITEDQVALYQHQLSDVLSYIDRLRTLNLDGVEPLTHAGDTTNRMRADEPGPLLTNEAALSLAPDAQPPYFKVPKVIGDGGGA